MLNIDPHAAPACRPGAPDTPTTPCRQTLAAARLKRLAEAEARARQGTFEIWTGLDAHEIRAEWSTGIYTLLGRKPEDGPLPREEYFHQYVHPDDRERLLAATREVFSSLEALDLHYRLLRHDGSMVYVAEQLSLIATNTTGRIFFGDVRQRMDRETAPLPGHDVPAMLQALYEDPASPPTIKAMIATFDALKDGEQRRLTREMHDDFGQLLAAMKLDLSLLQKALTGQERVAWEQLDNLHELVDSMIVSVRRIIAELPPKAVEELGLFAALEQLVTGFRKRHRTFFTLTLEPDNVRLGHGLELSIYRIVQEALNNIARHAQARTVVVKAVHLDDRLCLEIRDDGRGTTAADLRKTGSFGVLWMRERVVALDGTMTIESEAGQGTTIDIVVPTGGSRKARDVRLPESMPDAAS